MLKRLLLYFWVISIPLFLGLNAWQAARYYQLAEEVRRLEKVQQDQIEQNKRIVAGIAVLSGSERIAKIARDELLLQKKDPSEIMQIHIGKRTNQDG
ncbi:septum formation initiator family protein [Gracilinema caldarium]|uniref:septum formation initiator family protein n=1 Tax=Gracilinema caldarium TaxID=215591 RepID=UPI0026F05CA1|nr:septum formation initiator family protein [Gracilinema caldarium]